MTPDPRHLELTDHTITPANVTTLRIRTIHAIPTLLPLGLVNPQGYKTEILLNRHQAIELARALAEYAADPIHNDPNYPHPEQD